MRAKTVLLEGAIAGIIGAVMVAAWFLAYDLLPFFALPALGLLAWQRAWRALASVAGPGTGQVAATEPRDIELALLAPAAGGGGGGGCTGVCPPRAADTPELSSFALLASGLASLAGSRLRRRKMHR